VYRFLLLCLVGYRGLIEDPPCLTQDFQFCLVLLSGELVGFSACLGTVLVCMKLVCERRLYVCTALECEFDTRIYLLLLVLGTYLE
jgi:hypothetical protein